MRELRIGTKLKLKSKSNESIVLITNISGSMIELEDIYLGVKLSYSYSQISELIMKDKASFIYTSGYETETENTKSIDFQSYPENLKNTAKKRLLYIEKTIEKNISKYTPETLDPIILEVSNEIGEKGPNWRTLVRWISCYKKAGYSIRGLIPNNNNIGKVKKVLTDEQEFYIERAIEKFKTMERPSIKTVYRDIKTEIDNTNLERSKKNEIKVPNYSTLYNRIKKLAPYEISLAREGKEITRSNFRERKNYKKTTRIQERYDTDHTKLNLFVIDDDTSLPLGRPQITSVIDHYSRSVTGFNIGFEAADLASVIKALKHAFLSKSYILEKYPNIINEWPVYGKPSKLVTDRGKEFESSTIDDICLDLGIILQRNPVKKPWYKARIESHFNVINQELLDNIPGKTFRNIIAKGDYDPSKNAVISFSKFIEIFHIWVVDIYQQTPRADNKLIPDTWWRESAEKYPPIPYSSEKLDIIISISEERKLQRYGLKFDSIIYDSRELFDYRCRKGFIEVKLKYNPDDLGKIYVLDEDKQEFFDVFAQNFEYANRLSKYQHKVIKKYIRDKLNDDVNTENLARAKQEIQNIINSEIKSKKAKSRSRASRFKKITQSEVINNKKHDKITTKKPEKDEIKNIPSNTNMKTQTEKTEYDHELRLGGTFE